MTFRRSIVPTYKATCQTLAERRATEQRQQLERVDPPLAWTLSGLPGRVARRWRRIEYASGLRRRGLQECHFDGVQPSLRGQLPDSAGAGAADGEKADGAEHLAGHRSGADGGAAGGDGSGHGEWKKAQQASEGSGEPLGLGMGLLLVGFGGSWSALVGFGGCRRNPEGVDHVATPLSFERLPDEPAADYAALLQYRDLGPGRSLSQAAVVTGVSEFTLRRIAKRWKWKERLEAYDVAFLERMAVSDAEAEQARHRGQLVAFRNAQHRRAKLLADAAERLLELVVESTRKHLAAGTLLQPAQLGAGLTAVARALEASGSTAAMALGVEELLEVLILEEPST